MSEKPAKTTRSTAMSAAITATELARAMVVAIAIPGDWFDTKSSRRERAARLIGISPRRVRAILSGNEKIRLSADEYFAIERAYERAGHALASLSNLACEANVSANHRDERPRAEAEATGGFLDAQACGRPAVPTSPRGRLNAGER